MPSFHNLSGTHGTTTPVTLLLGPDVGAYLVRLITLHNPASNSAAPFIIQRVVPDELQTEREVILWDDSIAAGGTWSVGTLGAYTTLEPAQRLELVLDAAELTPISWSLDYVTTP